MQAKAFPDVDVEDLQALFKFLDSSQCGEVTIRPEYKYCIIQRHYLGMGAPTPSFFLHGRAPSLLLRFRLNYVCLVPNF